MLVKLVRQIVVHTSQVTDRHSVMVLAGCQCLSARAKNLFAPTAAGLPVCLRSVLPVLPYGTGAAALRVDAVQPHSSGTTVASHSVAPQGDGYVRSLFVTLRRGLAGKSWRHKRVCMTGLAGEVKKEMRSYTGMRMHKAGLAGG
jgi:hypothetical protein